MGPVSCLQHIFPAIGSLPEFITRLAWRLSPKGQQAHSSPNLSVPHPHSLCMHVQVLELLTSNTSTPPTLYSRKHLSASRPGQHEPQQQPRLFINSIAKGIPLYPELLSPPSSFPIPPPPFCPKTVETWRLTGTLNHSRKPQSSWQFTKAEQSSYWGKEGYNPQPSGSGAMLAQLNGNMAMSRFTMTRVLLGF